jgi:hypothetical protein
MGTNYAGSSSYTQYVVLTADGDPANAATINSGLQPLANRTTWLRSHFTSSTVTRFADFATCNDGTAFTQPYHRGRWYHHTVTSSPLVFPITSLISPYHGAKILSVQFMIDPPGSHTGLISELGKPQIMLIEQFLDGTGNTFTATDPSADWSTYQAGHSITLTLGTPRTINCESFTYYLQFIAEYGDNALSGTEIYTPLITIDGSNGLIVGAA